MVASGALALPSLVFLPEGLTKISSADVDEANMIKVNNAVRKLRACEEV